MKSCLAEKEAELEKEKLDKKLKSCLAEKEAELELSLSSLSLSSLSLSKAKIVCLKVDVLSVGYDTHNLLTSIKKRDEDERNENGDVALARSNNTNIIQVNGKKADCEMACRDLKKLLDLRRD